jgi:hypothetical protein
MVAHLEATMTEAIAECTADECTAVDLLGRDEAAQVRGEHRRVRRNSVNPSLLEVTNLKQKGLILAEADVFPDGRDSVEATSRPSPTICGIRCRISATTSATCSTRSSGFSANLSWSAYAPTKPPRSPAVDSERRRRSTRECGMPSCLASSSSRGPNPPPFTTATGRPTRRDVATTRFAPFAPLVLRTRCASDAARAETLVPRPLHS